VRTSLLAIRARRITSCMALLASRRVQLGTLQTAQYGSAQYATSSAKAVKMALSTNVISAKTASSTMKTDATTFAPKGVTVIPSLRNVKLATYLAQTALVAAAKSATRACPNSSSSFLLSARNLPANQTNSSTGQQKSA